MLGVAFPFVIVYMTFSFVVFGLAFLLPVVGAPVLIFSFVRPITSQIDQRNVMGLTNENVSTGAPTTGKRNAKPKTTNEKVM
jgi:hypothetical protein